MKKSELENIDNELNEKVELLKQEFKSVDENKKNNISKVLSEYICARDYIGAYYNEKYFKERSKNRSKANFRNNKIKLKASVNWKHLLFLWKNMYI